MEGNYPRAAPVDSERAQDRALNRALRDRLHDLLKNPV
jgi:hypothetical protein